MKAIREAVPKIDANTYIQKTIPASDIDKYIGEDGWSTIGGYVARYDDVSHIKGYDNVVESSRLDYVSSAGQTIINFINNFVNNGVCPALQ